MQLAKIIKSVYCLLVFCVICILPTNLDGASSHASQRTRRQSDLVPPFFLLYAFQDNVTTILRFNLDGTGFYLVREQTVSVPSPPSPQFLSVDFSLATSSVYFSLGTRIGVASLHESEQTSSSLSIINPGQLDSVGPLTFDWIRNLIYFVGTDDGTKGIYSYDVSSDLTTLLSLISDPSLSPKLCTAANDSLLFWNEGNTIQFGSPESRMFVIFEEIDASTFGNILDLFCDSSSKLLSVYLSERSILQYDYTAVEPRTPTEVNTLVEDGPQSVLFPNNALRFANFNNGLFFLLSSNNLTFIQRSIRSTNDIVNYPISFTSTSFALVQPLLQPAASIFTLPCGSEPCCANNGGCSQVCVQSSLDSYYCSCRPGFTLTSFTACSLSSNTASLVYSYYQQLSANIKVSVVRSRNLVGQSSQASLVNAQYMGQPTEKIEQLAISISNDELYILETKPSTLLSRISLSNPYDKQTILNLGSMGIGTLRYDWISNFLYWTTFNGSILRMRPNDLSFETFLLQDKTLGLALHPLKELICYSVILNVTASDIICVNSTKAEVFRIAVGYPIVSLAVDLLEDRIYWGGRRQGFFQSCAIYNMTDCFSVPYPVLPGDNADNDFTFFIYIVGRRIVWLPIKSLTIVQMDKLTGGDVIPFTISDVSTNIISVNALDVRVTFYQPGLGYLGCLMDNGGCSHFCIPSSSGDSFSCGCADGFLLTDNVTCQFIAPQTTAPPTVTATATPCDPMFCVNGGTCMTSISLGRTCSCPAFFIGARCETIDENQFALSGDDKQETKSIIGGAVGAVVVLFAFLAVIGVVMLLLFIRFRMIQSKPTKEGKEGKADREVATYVNESCETQKDKS